MQYMNFEPLIKQHSRDITVITYSEDGYNESGDFVKGERIETTVNGAIVSHKQSKIFRSEGTLTSQDKALYMLTPLASALKGGQILDRGKLYSIASELENAEFTGVYAYNLKFVSIFNEVEQNG